MWKKWTKFCQWNVDNYNNHRVGRTVFLCVYIVVACVGFMWMAAVASKDATAHLFK